MLRAKPDRSREVRIPDPPKSKMGTSATGHARCPSLASSHEAPGSRLRRKLILSKDVRWRGAIARRSQRRLSRIAKGLRSRCYPPPAFAWTAKGDGYSATRLKFECDG